MHRHARKIIVSTLITLISCGAAAAAQLPLEDQIDAAALAHLNTTAPAISITVSKAGQPLFSRAYGPGVTPDTPFSIGSVTKQFTAAAVLKLAERNKLSLDDPITKHLPDYPIHGQTITLRHLLTHTSGIKSFDLTEDAGQLFASPNDLAYPDILSRFCRQPLDFPPGTKHQYNNTGYWLLGEIISRTSGTSYADFLDREFIQPLSLTHTTCSAPAIAAPGHTARPINFRSVGAAGALFSTPTDLARWTHLLHSGQVLSPDSLKQMITPGTLSTGQTVNYGLGLFLDTFQGHPKIHHGGRGAGFLTCLSHYPNDGITIAICMASDSDREKRDQLERSIARIALGLTAKDLSLTPADLARYQGTYTLASASRTTELRVYAQSDHLYAQLGTAPPTRLRHQSDHTFLHQTNDDVQLTFTTRNDRAQSVALTQGSRTFTGPRTP